jgi:hypothetical protein
MTADNSIKYSPHRLESTADAPTPRTKANVKRCAGYLTRDHSYIEVVPVGFSRQLERELTAAREQIARLKEDSDFDHKEYKRLVAALEAKRVGDLRKCVELVMNEQVGHNSASYDMALAHAAAMFRAAFPEIEENGHADIS